MTWNIQVGADTGVFQNNWPKRKLALRKILAEDSCDIICLQEVLQEQLAFMEGVLPDYAHVGVARDDGRTKGEFCPIFFDKKKFEVIRSGTFWLSDTPDNSKNTWDLIYKRICTWAQFRSKQGTEFFVFNTHFPLNPLAQKKSAELILKKIAAICASEDHVLVGDFNCKPDSEAWKTFSDAGLRNCEAELKNGAMSPTHTVFGNSSCIDGVFVSKNVVVTAHQLVDQSINGIQPSDHFGTAVRLVMQKE